MTQIFSSPSQIVLAVGLLFFLSVLANKLSDRFGVPTLLMFLAVGMLAGSDGIGGIYFDNVATANFIGILALAYILFSGGLDTGWSSVRPVLRPALILSTLGVAVTAGLVGLFAWLILDLSLLDGLLLGAIVSSTDAAAVFSIMRSGGVGLKGRLKPLLELESGSNDPMAVFLTTAVLGLILHPEGSWVTLIPSLLLRMSCGIAVGMATGWLTSLLFNRVRLEYEGLYPVLSMSIVLLVYGLAELLHGNGFLAVYTCGIVLGNRDFLHKHYLGKFHDGLGWLMQIVLFLTLGLLVFPSRLPAVALPAILISLFLMFVARPAAVYLGLWRSGFSGPEKTLVAWTGLRGAVPIVLATFPLMAGYEHSDLIFNLVFFIVLSSVLFQGKTLMPVARRLKVDEPLVARPRYPLEFEKSAGMHSETREIDIPPEAFAVGRRIADLALPPDALILLIRRGQQFIVPKGQTQIEAFDTLMFIAEKETLKEARNILLAARPVEQPATT
jgi:cell volume regulation protein A